MKKNILETCWFLKSRRCVACVKLESYLLLIIPNSHSEVHMKETKFLACILPATTTCAYASQLAVHYPLKSICIFGGGGAVKMKTFQNPKQQVSND